MSRSKTVELHADPSPFIKTLEKLEALAAGSPPLLKIIQDFFDTTGQVELVEFKQETAARTGHLLIVIKPSDKLLELVTTLSTRKSELLSSDTK